jgi:hypothetical protein
VADDARIAREAMRIFGDDMTEESAARLRPLVDRPDGFGAGPSQTAQGGPG